MFDTRKSLGFALIALLIGGVVSFPTFVASAAEQDKVKAEAFVEIAKKAGEHAIALRDLVKSKDLGTGKMNESISKGETFLKEAQTLLANNEFAKAIEKARQAMKAFAEAMKSVGRATDIEKEKEAGRRILEAIARHRERIDKIRSALPNATGAPQKVVDAVNKIKGLLNEAEKLLKEAEDIIKSSPSNSSETAKKMGDANRKVAEAHKILIEVTRHHEAKRFAGFIKGIEKELDRAKKLVEQRGGSANLTAKLGDAEDLVKNAKTKLDSGDVKGALKDIKEAREVLHSVIKELAKARGK